MVCVAPNCRARASFASDDEVMIASIPIAWFFTAALPTEMTLFAVPLRLEVMVLVVHAVVFLGVSVAMMDVFSRVMAALEPEHARPLWWLLFLPAWR